MELLDKLREAAMSALCLLVSGAALSLIIGRLISARAGAAETLSDLRMSRALRQERIARALPGTLPLDELPRVRPEALAPEFSEPALLAFVQEAFERLLVRVLAGQPPELRVSEGAMETLRSGPALGEIREVVAERAWLQATDRSPEWLTVDVGVCGLLLEARERAPVPWRLEQVWRLRLRAELPVPDETALSAMGPADALWELLAVLDQQRVRLDTLPPELLAWGPLTATPEPAPGLASRRTEILDELRASGASPDEALERVAEALVRAALVTETLSGGPDELLAPPLSRAIAGARAARQVCGQQERLEDLEVVNVTLLELRPHPTGPLWTAHLVVQGRRWLEDAAGNFLAGDLQRPSRGALELRARWSGHRWRAWDIRPSRG